MKFSEEGVFSSVQSISCVRFFVTPWTAAGQVSLSIINSRSLFKLMSMGWWCHPIISFSVVPFCPQSFPASGSFQMSQFFASGGQSIGISASTSVFPMKTQDWSPLGWTGWILLQSKGFSRVFSNTTVQKHQFSGTSAFFTVQRSHPYMTTGKIIALTRWTPWRDFPGGSDGKSICLQSGRPTMRSSQRVGQIPWRRKWQPTLVFLPGKSHGQRSLAGYSPWGHKESDKTEQCHFTWLDGTLLAK